MDHSLFDIGLERGDMSVPYIPEGAYRPVKRCPNCQSVYLTDTKCEACGRSLLFHTIGEPFSSKSFYGIKARYIESLPTVVTFFPFLENKSDSKAKSYQRYLLKRFDELLTGFGSEAMIKSSERKFFYIESLALIDELVSYGLKEQEIILKIEEKFDDVGALLAARLIEHAGESSHLNSNPKPRLIVFLNYRLMNWLRVDFILKSSIIIAAVCAAAISYYDIISWQVGK